MSRHTTFIGNDYEVCIGVDRPLRNVFASIDYVNPPEDADSDSVPDFNPFSWFAPTTEGVGDACRAVAAWATKHGLDFTVPADMVRMLDNDVDNLARGGDLLNYAQHHR